MHPRTLELGPTQDDNQQVLSGLRAGERIVLNPSGLAENQRIHPIHP
ncbi:MAG: hypothetical protein ACQKBU_07720 [Verrucomicrobiales bacterium]